MFLDWQQMIMTRSSFHLSSKLHSHHLFAPSIYAFFFLTICFLLYVKKGKYGFHTPWHSYRLLRGCFLLFTKGFSLRTVGILVLAHPTQNLFAQIFPIILQTIVWQKHFNKMRFCLVTLSYTVTSKVSPAHSTNNKSNKPKSLMILDFHKPSAGCLLAWIVYHPLKNALLDGNVWTKSDHGAR